MRGRLQMAWIPAVVEPSGTTTGVPPASVIATA